MAVYFATLIQRIVITVIFMKDFRYFYDSTKLNLKIPKKKAIKNNKQNHKSNILQQKFFYNL